uniref:insulinase family protein n=1 Tax=Geoalkalibacter halelectricus TaxID=2847045 RepID=UPI003D1C14E3
TCDIADGFERLALDLLSILLLGNPAAPLYKALLDSRLGSNLAPGSGYHDDYRTTLFAAGLQGTDPEHAEAIEKVVLETLEEVARRGFSRERIEGVIHRFEFGHREVTGDSYPYALMLCMRLLGPWMHCGDAVSALRISTHLERLRKELEAGPFFENLIRRQLLDNPHRVTLTLRPDPEQKRREEQQTAERLAAIQATLTAQDRQRLVEEARLLKEVQEAEEDLSCLPSLELSDIPAEEPTVPSTSSTESGLCVQWFAQPTNGIGYFIAHLDASALDPEHQPYLPLFCSLLTQIGAAGLNYMEMAERIEAGTGGIAASTEILEDPRDTSRFQALVQIRGKALVRNQDKLFGILSDIFAAPDFSDRDRLRTVLGQIKTTLENSIPSSGHSYAARAAAARLSPAARLRETWSGLELIGLTKKTAELKDEALDEFAGRMQAIAAALLRRNQLSCALVAEERDFEKIRPALNTFLAGLAPQATEPVAPPTFNPQPVRLGWIASVPVSFVTRVFPTVPFTHADSGGLLVLAKLLRASYLHREIREKGGAYGGMSSANPETGLMSLLSYRDPHLVRTLRVYDEAAHWAAAGRFSDQEIKEAILAVFSELDRPLSPGGRGYREFANTRQGLTLEMRQDLRHKVLATDRTALQRLAQTYLVEGRARSAVSVLAGEDLLRKANAELGGEGLEIRKI